MSEPRLWLRYLTWEFFPPVVVGMILLGLGLGVRFLYLTENDLESRYLRSGVRAGAKVLRAQAEKTKVRSPNRSTSTVFIYKVEYQFTYPDNVAHRGTSSISEGQFQTLKPGHSITVEYLRDDPATSRMVGAQANGPALLWLALGLIGTGGLLAILGVLGLGYQSLKAKRRARVVRTGSPYHGIVTEIDEHPVRNGAARFILSFEFHDADGDAYDGWVWLPARLRDRWNPGKTILVLWDGTCNSYPEPDIFETRPDDELARLRETATLPKAQPSKRNRPKPRDRRGRSSS